MVSEINFIVLQRGFQSMLGLVTVAGIKARCEVRIHAFEGAELAVQKLPDHFAEPGNVLRKARRMDGMALRAQRGSQEFGLAAVTAAVDSFEGDEFSANRDECGTVYPDALG